MDSSSSCRGIGLFEILAFLAGVPPWHYTSTGKCALGDIRGMDCFLLETLLLAIWMPLGLD